jgi:hypothetical protein
MNTQISFQLSDSQQEKYDEWMCAIHKIYGKYGIMTWSYSSNGIGASIKVHSELANVTLDLTNVDEF